MPTLIEPSPTSAADALPSAAAPAPIRKHVLYGRKVVLFELEPQDVPRLVALHRADTKGYMLNLCLKDMTEDEATRYVTMLLLSGRIAGWSVYTKLGHPERIGFVYLSDVTTYSATLSGIMDTHTVKGLGARIREGKYTYAEDVSRVLIEHCFTTLGLSRLDTMVRADNRRALLLDRKVGWKQEGVLREASMMSGEPKDVVCLAILRKEWR